MHAQASLSHQCSLKLLLFRTFLRLVLLGSSRLAGTCYVAQWLTDWPWTYFPLVPALKCWDYRHAPVCLTPLVQCLGFCVVYILLLLTGISMSLCLVHDTPNVRCWDASGEEQNRIRQFWVTSWLLKQCHAELSREELEQRITLFFFKRAIISHS